MSLMSKKKYKETYTIENLENGINSVKNKTFFL